MLCLTIRQPWAGAILDLRHPKDIENRGWSTAHRARIGIHAGKRVDAAGVQALPDAPVDDLGKIIGTVEITGCHIQDSEQCHWHHCRENPWAQFSEFPDAAIWHWELEHPRTFVTPIPERGALKLWEPGPSAAHLMSIADFR